MIMIYNFNINSTNTFQYCSHFIDEKIKALSIKYQPKSYDQGENQNRNTGQPHSRTQVFNQLRTIFMILSQQVCSSQGVLTYATILSTYICWKSLFISVCLYMIFSKFISNSERGREQRTKEHRCWHQLAIYNFMTLGKLLNICSQSINEIMLRLVFSLQGCIEK